MKLISGNSNKELATKVSKTLGIPLLPCTIQRFGDQEIFVEIEEVVRGQDVFVIQSTSDPANDHLMELLIIMDTLKRSSTRSITAIVPYFGYARQDRKTSIRSPITAKLIANLITVAGADSLITFDLHSSQLEGFFDIPTNNLPTAPLFCQDILERFKDKPIVIVSPDIGGVGRARRVAEKLHKDLVIVDKRRLSPGKSEVAHIIGEVKGRHCLLIDDIIDTAGTLCHAAETLMKEGALSVDAYVSHGVLTGTALQEIEASALGSLTLCDTIKELDKLAQPQSKIRYISVAPLLSEALRRINKNESVSELCGC